MAEPEVVIDEGEQAGAMDETLGEADSNEAFESTAAEPAGLEDVEPDLPERTTFLE